MCMHITYTYAHTHIYIMYILYVCICHMSALYICYICYIWYIYMLYIIIHMYRVNFVIRIFCSYIQILHSRKGWQSKSNTKLEYSEQLPRVYYHLKHATDLLLTLTVCMPQVYYGIHLPMIFYPILHLLQKWVE